MSAKVVSTMSGLCECGCGETTNILSKDAYRKGQLIARKGEHRRFVVGHGSRVRDIDPALRVDQNIEKDESSGCWNWTASRDTNGYGHLRSRSATLQAHRVMWEIHRGPIPAGLEVDHLCRNRACVNPDHLEPVTPAENKRRAGRRLRTGACHRGHAMTPENTYVSPRGRENCRECCRVNQRRRAARV